MTHYSSSANRFAPIHDPVPLSTAFLNITELQINKTLLTWNEMQAIIAFMPRIQTVEMGYNHIHRLSDDNEEQISDPSSSNAGILALQTLNLDSNHLRDWVHILQSLQPYIS